jgi:uncharacterized metal-binding protein
MMGHEEKSMTNEALQSAAAEFLRLMMRAAERGAEAAPSIIDAAGTYLQVVAIGTIFAYVILAGAIEWLWWRWSKWQRPDYIGTTDFVVLRAVLCVFLGVVTVGWAFMLIDHGPPTVAAALDKQSALMGYALEAISKLK